MKLAVQSLPVSRSDHRDSSRKRTAELIRLGFYLSTATEPAEAAQHVIETSLEFFDWDAAFLHLYDPETDTMTELVNMDTIDGERIPVTSVLQDKSPSPLLREVMNEGGRLILRQHDNEGPMTVRFGDTTRLSMSLMFVPVRIEDRNIGVLSVQSYRTDAYTKLDLEILQGLADHVAGALARIQAESALKESEERLKAHARNLEKTVARRTANLQETMEELQHFSYALTHDMRAPLRAMQSFAQLLEFKCRSWNDPEALEFCERIKNATGRMDTLIQDSLHYSRAVLEEWPLRPIDLPALLRDLIDSYPELQKWKGAITIDPSIPKVMGNEAALTQCFSSLLRNAVKFVATGITPRVRVWGERRESLARIWVEDNGIGIPRRAQERIFEIFERATHRRDGTGIGLAIVRKVAHRMGGCVGVESEQGKGSRFWVELLAT